jgi:hypothetical protein
MKQPSERRYKLIPNESQLNAILRERQKNPKKPNKTRHSNHH